MELTKENLAKKIEEARKLGREPILVEEIAAELQADDATDEWEAHNWLHQATTEIDRVLGLPSAWDSL